jgi:hypothetical protein
MLQMFSRLSVRDPCQCVTPVCKKWNILARHPSLRKELSFGKDISKYNVLKLLHESPLLRRLSLKDRHDTDAIPRRVRKSNPPFEMVECQGSARRRQVNGEILTRILESCPKLCQLVLTETVVESLEFYRTVIAWDPQESEARQSRIMMLLADMCWTSQCKRRTVDRKQETLKMFVFVLQNFFV